MLIWRISAALGLTLSLTSLGGCNGEGGDVSGEDAGSGAAGQLACEADEPEALGLMTSLPLNYPLGAGIAEIASGRAEVPWQASGLARCYTVMPLDSLSATQAVGPGLPATNPLDGIENLAVIQPRGLSPADNVALDDWVRAGGHLLLALDPMLTGEYALRLGDPRRPNVVALIPPVAAHWGMVVTFDDDQSLAPRKVEIGNAEIHVVLAGEVAVTGGQCDRDDAYPVQKCRVGDGRVTLIADAAIFEDEQLAGPKASAMHALLAAAFSR